MKGSLRATWCGITRCHHGSQVRKPLPHGVRLHHQQCGTQGEGGSGGCTGKGGVGDTLQGTPTPTPGCTPIQSQAKGEILPEVWRGGNLLGAKRRTSEGINGEKYEKVR